VHDASCDEERIRRWWIKWPGANVGIATGKAAVGCFVVVDLDCDARRDGLKELTKLATASGAHLPAAAPTTYTPRGFHLWFATDTPLPNRAGVVPGVDIRGSGGYVVGPGSCTQGDSYFLSGSLRTLPRLPFWLRLALEGNADPQAAAEPLPGSTGRTDRAFCVGRPRRSRRDYGGQLGVLVDWDARDDVKRALQEHLGVSDRFLPFWRETDSREDSAEFWHDGEIWLVRDFGGPKHGTLRSLSLTELYAAKETGEARRLRAGELAIWKIRMLIVLGFLVPPEVEVHATSSDITPLAQALYGDVVELIRCRWIAEPGEPFLASIPFRQAWSRTPAVRNAGIGTISAARSELVSAGLIHEVGVEAGSGGRRPTPKFMPGPQLRVDAGPIAKSYSPRGLADRWPGDRSRGHT
jgi:hypothetical protein